MSSAATLGASFAPNYEKFTKSLSSQPLEVSVASLISLLKRRQIQGPEQCALATANTLLQVVAKSSWINEEDLLNHIALVGQRLLEAQPNELVVGNIVRRVLSLIRDEAAEERGENMDEHGEDEEDPEALTLPTLSMPPKPHPIPFRTMSTLESSSHVTREDSTPPSPMEHLSQGAKLARPTSHSSFTPFSVPKSLFSLLSTLPGIEPYLESARPQLRRSGTSTPSATNLSINQYRNRALRSEVIHGIEEIKDEIEQVADQIASAETQVRPCDYVLIHKPNSIIKRYLVKAAARRKFTVFLACPPPPPGGRSLQQKQNPYASFRKDLTKAGITVINILNSGTLAYMPQVTRVILSARAVLADGAVIVDAGAGAIARAAKDMGRSVVVLSGVYQLSPESPLDTASLIEWGDPMAGVDFANGTLVGGVDVRVAVTELLPAHLVDIYITNLGTHCRNHLPGIISEHYKREDMDFYQWGENL